MKLLNINNIETVKPFQEHLSFEMHSLQTRNV